MTQQPVRGVVAEDVVVRFGDVTALDGVSVSFSAGVTALLGENGAGKTTLMRVLATLLRPQAGRLVVDGSPVVGARAAAAYRRRIGYLPQSVPALKHLSVQQLMEYFAFLKGVRPADAADEVRRCLDRVGLTEKASARSTSLSGGMRRRMGLAVALLGEPQILLLDEPTAGLDPLQRVEMRDLVRDCAQERPVLLSTHLSEDVRALADRTLVLHSGRLIFDGSLAELTGQELSAGVRSGGGTSGANDVEAAFIALVRSHGSAL